MNRSFDPVHGSLLKNVLIFTPPLMISILLQRLFNATDTLIVGHFCGSQALASVGAGGPMINFFVWGLISLSVGSDVVISTLIGEGNHKDLFRAMHCIYFLAIISGLIFSLAGILLSPVILRLMSVPDYTFTETQHYCQIYFTGLIFTAIYNFGASILRSSGDTRQPTFFLFLGGLLNVVLDLLFVVTFHWQVAGAAFASAISQLFSAALVTLYLCHGAGPDRLYLNKIRPDPKFFRKILSIGIPSSIQGIMFSISNIIVQSSINTFGSAAIAANSAALTLEDFVYVASSAFNQTTVTFTGLNAGAGKTKRIPKILVTMLILSGISGYLIGFLDYHFGPELLGLFTNEVVVIRLGMYRLHYVASLLFLNGTIDVFVGSMRGMGYSTRPTLVTLTTICGSRILFILTWFKTHHSLDVLYLCFPLSWIIAIICQFFLWIYLYHQYLSRTAAA